MPTEQMHLILSHPQQWGKLLGNKRCVFGGVTWSRGSCLATRCVSAERPPLPWASGLSSRPFSPTLATRGLHLPWRGSVLKSSLGLCFSERGCSAVTVRGASSGPCGERGRDWSSVLTSQGTEVARGHGKPGETKKGPSPQSLQTEWGPASPLILDCWRP